MGLTGATTKVSDLSYWIDPIKVLDVTNISGQPAMEGWTANDCALEVKYARIFEAGPDEGKFVNPDEDPWSMFCMGNFRKNTQGKIEDWGGAFKVRVFLEACGNSGTFTDDDGNLDEKVVNTCINKSVYKISYRSTEMDSSGNNKVKTWSGRFFKTSTDAKKAWLKSTKTGWPKDYMGLAGNETMEGRGTEDVPISPTQFPTDL